MPYAPQGIAVEPNGQTVVVTITEQGGGTPTVYTDRTAQTTIAMPATISARTIFYLTDRTTFTVSCTVGGLENANGLGGTTAVDLSGGGFASVGVGVPVETPTVASSTYPSMIVAAGTGIDPAGVADSTTALQAKINAAIAAATPLFIPAGTYKLTAALVINGAVKIVGAGCEDLFGSAITGGANALNIPTVAPYLTGTVLRQDTISTDAIQITAAGRTVDLSDFGITFGTPYVTTGHGINATPASDGANYDNGPVGFRWVNVKVYGHDGDHYAFRLVNPLIGSLDDLRSYGGGGLHILQNSSRCNCGNLVIKHPYMVTFLAGAADGMRFERVAGTLNLVTMIRPQVWLLAPSPAVSGTTPPTNAQRVVNTTDITGNTKNFTIIAPDFETNVSAAVKLPVLGTNMYSLGQVASYDAANADIPGTINSGVAYQNLRPNTQLHTSIFAMNPTGGAAATVVAKIANNSGMSGATTVHSVSVPAAGPIGSIVSLPMYVPGGWFLQYTYTNATRMWSASQVGS